MNIFDKCWADILSEHSQHNLVIKIEGDQIPPFGLIYDHSKSELEVLCEYINDMLEKKFIIFSESPLEAPILFTKKSDRGLYLYVDFCGLNAMIKKNKHLLPLIYTLLDLLAKTKHYTKVNFIAAYNLLHIKQSNKWKMAFQYQYKYFEY